MNSSEITQSYIKSIFYYENGNLFWKIKKSKKTVIGTKAGTKTAKLDDYKRVRMDKKDYLLHRIVFLYHFGYLPKYVDHIDGIKTNNLIENLRECDQSENMCNVKKLTTNSSGIKGVSWRKDTSKWRARVRFRNKEFFIGYFDDLQTAENSARLFREELHKEFCNHG
jgi:hypothetical protein